MKSPIPGFMLQEWTCIIFCRDRHNDRRPADKVMICIFLILYSLLSTFGRHTYCYEILYIMAKRFDTKLSVLCDRAADYARLYLRAKKEKGCNGLGEKETLLDEFRRMLQEIMHYSGRKKYIDHLLIYEIDVTDEEIEKLSMHLETVYKG